jgi:uncharacterized membrane protein YfcA
VELIWLYVGVALIAAIGAIFLGRMVKDKSAKRRVGAWIAILVGAGFFLSYALKLDQDVFILVLGLICLITGINALESSRLQDRIYELQNEIKTLRGGSDGPPR